MSLDRLSRQNQARLQHSDRFSNSRHREAAQPGRTRASLGGPPPRKFASTATIFGSSVRFAKRRGRSRAAGLLGLTMPKRANTLSVVPRRALTHRKTARARDMSGTPLYAACDVFASRLAERREFTEGRCSDRLRICLGLRRGAFIAPPSMWAAKSTAAMPRTGSIRTNSSNRASKVSMILDMAFLPIYSPVEYALATPSWSHATFVPIEGNSIQS